VLRATEDGLVDGGLIVDDRLICSTWLQAIEVVGWTGAVIEVEQLDEWTAYDHDEAELVGMGIRSGDSKRAVRA
jgi:hypothetical protein